jgi:hypothetical protein
MVRNTPLPKILAGFDQFNLRHACCAIKKHALVVLYHCGGKTVAVSVNTTLSEHLRSVRIYCA